MSRPGKEPRDVPEGFVRNVDIVADEAFERELERLSCVLRERPDAISIDRVATTYHSLSTMFALGADGHPAISFPSLAGWPLPGPCRHSTGIGPQEAESVLAALSSATRTGRTPKFREVADAAAHDCAAVLMAEDPETHAAHTRDDGTVRGTIAMEANDGLHAMVLDEGDDPDEDRKAWHLPTALSARIGVTLTANHDAGTGWTIDAHPKYVAGDDVVLPRLDAMDAMRRAAGILVECDHHGKA